MKQRLSWLQRLADGADLIEESLPGIPLVEIAGEGRVLVECHDGLVEYEKEQISVKVHYGLVCISGSGLELTKMTKDKIVVSGRIDGVTLRREDR